MSSFASLLHYWRLEIPIFFGSVHLWSSIYLAEFQYLLVFLLRNHNQWSHCLGRGHDNLRGGEGMDKFIWRASKHLYKNFVSVVERGMKRPIMLKAQKTDSNPFFFFPFLVSVVTSRQY